MTDSAASEKIAAECVMNQAAVLPRSMRKPKASERRMANCASRMSCRFAGGACAGSCVDTCVVPVERKGDWIIACEAGSD